MRDPVSGSVRHNNLFKRIMSYKYIYMMLLPVLLYYIIFKYIPIYGVQLAFKEFAFGKGISGSVWTGLDNFRYLFIEHDFWIAFKNTIIISFMKLILGFPIPVILSILINELVMPRFKRGMQIIYTFPHFLSWIILSGIMFNLLSSTGAVNNLFALFGLERMNFMTDVGIFRFLLVYSDIWKEAGWSTIIYMAAITGIDPSLYEAAYMDGANRWHKIRYIVWPGIRSVVVVMMILQVGQIMSAGFMQVLNLYNPAVYSVADILDTYVYRISFQGMPKFGVSTAVSLFIGITNCILLLTADKIASFFGESGVM